jgi:RNA recognition motif-containing protein
MDMNAPFSGGPANGGPPNNGMAFQNGTPPASDMSAPPSGGGQDTPKTTLWMGELEPWMDENFIKGVFMSTTAEQVNVKVIRDKNSGNAGYCFVEFPTPEAANKALTLNGTPVPNSSRQFKLNWASGGGLVDRRITLRLTLRSQHRSISSWI